MSNSSGKLYHLNINGNQVGPIPADEVRARLSRGEIHGATLTWAAGMPEWLPLAMVEEFSDINENSLGELSVVPVHAFATPANPLPAKPKAASTPPTFQIPVPKTTQQTQPPKPSPAKPQNPAQNAPQVLHVVTKVEAAKESEIDELSMPDFPVLSNLAPVPMGAMPNSLINEPITTVTGPYIVGLVSTGKSYYDENVFPRLEAGENPVNLAAFIGNLFWLGYKGLWKTFAVYTVGYSLIGAFCEYLYVSGGPKPILFTMGALVLMSLFYLAKQGNRMYFDHLKQSPLEQDSAVRGVMAFAGYVVLVALSAFIANGLAPMREPSLMQQAISKRPPKLPGKVVDLADVFLPAQPVQLHLQSSDKTASMDITLGPVAGSARRHMLRVETIPNQPPHTQDLQYEIRGNGIYLVNTDGVEQEAKLVFPRVVREGETANAGGQVWKLTTALFRSTETFPDGKLLDTCVNGVSENGQGGVTFCKGVGPTDFLVGDIRLGVTHESVKVALDPSAALLGTARVPATAIAAGPALAPSITDKNAFVGPPKPDSAPANISASNAGPITEMKVASPFVGPPAPAAAPGTIDGDLADYILPLKAPRVKFPSRGTSMTMNYSAKEVSADGADRRVSSRKIQDEQGHDKSEIKTEYELRKDGIYRIVDGGKNRHSPQRFSANSCGKYVGDARRSYF